MLFLTISIARSTPAQKPLGADNKIFNFFIFHFFQLNILAIYVERLKTPNQ